MMYILDPWGSSRFFFEKISLSGGHQSHGRSQHRDAFWAPGCAGPLRRCPVRGGPAAGRRQRSSAPFKALGSTINVKKHIVKEC